MQLPDDVTVRYAMGYRHGEADKERDKWDHCSKYWATGTEKQIKDYRQGYEDAQYFTNSSSDKVTRKKG